jgi:DNA (cytosine-5)-methyltransferase 1
MRLDPTSETFPIAPTLQANDGAKWGSNQWVDEGKAIVERVAETLMATDCKGPGHNRDHNFVAQPVAFTTEQTPKFNDDCALTLTKQSPTGGGQPQCVSVAMQVRRLTPVECERLQGFPDDYTNIPWRKKDEAPDGPRYKALGNSMAVPCMKWIGQRIKSVIAHREVQS